MNVARNLDEAKDWFLSHSSGSLLLRNERGDETVVDTYSESEEFFTSLT